MGKCQKFDACTLANQGNMNPLMIRIHSYWRKMGFFSNIAGCPVRGHYEACDIKLDSNLWTFLPKGVFMYTAKYYSGVNDEDSQLVFNISMVFINN